MTPRDPQSALMIQRREDVSIVEFLDMNVTNGVTIERIRDELMEHIELVGHPRIIISFAGVTHMSSALIGVVMAMHKKIAAAKGGLRLACVSPMVMEVLRMTRLDKVLKLYETTEKAMEKY